MSPSLVYLGTRVRYCGLGLKGLDECAAYFIWVKERSCDHLLARTSSHHVFFHYVHAPAVILASSFCVCTVQEEAAFRACNIEWELFSGNCA